MEKAELEILKVFIKTNPMFGVFALGNGRAWFCSDCGATVPRGADVAENMAVVLSQKPELPHKPDCGERAHARAKEFLRKAMFEAGVF